jgi:hypothetical protein
MNGGEDEHIYAIGGKAKRKEISRNIKIYVGGEIG